MLISISSCARMSQLSLVTESLSYWQSSGGLFLVLTLYKFTCDSVAPWLGDEKFELSVEKVRVVLGADFHKFGSVTKSLKK